MTSVLIVDDNKDLCEVVSSYLEGKFDHIELAHSVPEAIGKVKGALYNFIIVDLHLVSGNGETLIKYIRRDDSKNMMTPVLVISGEINFEKEKFKKTEFLPKPFSEDDLLSKMASFKKKKEQSSRSDDTVTHPELAKLLKNR